jgi:DNA-directed RNA polymerase alpha subunit
MMRAARARAEWKASGKSWGSFPIDDLGLPLRARNCLANERIEFVGELMQQTEADLMRLPNFGRKSLDAVKEALAQCGLRLVKRRKVGK